MSSCEDGFDVVDIDVGCPHRFAARRFEATRAKLQRDAVEIVDGQGADVAGAVALHLGIEAVESVGQHEASCGYRVLLTLAVGVMK